jgi:uncharacterized membrane protein
MAAFLGNLRNVVIAGFVLAALLIVFYVQIQGFDAYTFWPFFVRWLHVAAGVLWIGLLWYFNFVQMPTMPKIPDDLKPAVGKFIAPAALFYFRMAAATTILLGIILAWQNDYLIQAYSLGATEGFAVPKHIAIGIGMWLGTIMAYNVWFLIWPNQQKALNIDGKYPDLAPADKAAAAKTAMMFSRINTMLSIPMLFSMVAAQNIY